MVGMPVRTDTRNPGRPRRRAFAAARSVRRGEETARHLFTSCSQRLFLSPGVTSASVAARNFAHKHFPGVAKFFPKSLDLIARKAGLLISGLAKQRTPHVTPEEFFPPRRACTGRLPLRVDVDTRATRETYERSLTRTFDCRPPDSYFFRRDDGRLSGVASLKPPLSWRYL